MYTRSLWPPSVPWRSSCRRSRREGADHKRERQADEQVHRRRSEHRLQVDPVPLDEADEAIEDDADRRRQSAAPAMLSSIARVARPSGEASANVAMARVTASTAPYRRPPRRLTPSRG
jgi:hypothetical protein